MLDNQVKQFLAEVLNSAVADGGPGSGNYGHAGREGQQGGSAPKGVSSISNKTIKGARQLRDDVCKKILNDIGEDGTYTLDGKPVSFKSGYQVSFQTTGGEDKNSPTYMSDDEYDRLVDEMRKATGSEPFLGIFGEPEISFRCSSMKQAQELAIKYNQHSVYNWKSGSLWINPTLDKSTNNIR